MIPAGYTLALAVQGKDYQYSDEVRRVGWFTMTGVGPFKHDDPTNRPPDVYGGKVTLHLGGENDCYLMLPVIPAAG